MKLFIPDVGTELKLERDWVFTLHNEYRNQDLVQALRLDQDPDFVRAQTRCVELRALSKQRGAPVDATPLDLYVMREIVENFTWRVTLPAGTLLKIDRVYIRKGASDYSSLTFFVLESPHPALARPRDKARPGKAAGKRRRFWAKLADVNTMEIVA